MLDTSQTDPEIWVKRQFHPFSGKTMEKPYLRYLKISEDIGRYLKISEDSSLLDNAMLLQL